MTKSEIRKKYLQKRESLSQDEVIDFSEKIFQNFIARFKPVENQKVHVFLSIPEKGEVDTKLFLNYFFKNHIRVFVPKIEQKKMISVEITEETPLIRSSWGIDEPESNQDSGEKDFDFVLTPLLYCDRHGNRVGYGKGYYDGFFSTISKDALRIGVGFFDPEEEIEDLIERDVPLNYLVTPTEVLSFRGFTSKSTK
ncbi:5-formyltetrahydrofolate cyclo-ligase [Chryseobacterium koreense]|uniref:5-formyltetrahydrofolate cyclo-ligase n=1 Tax=Chryseobacterium koreense TaxID=232216 RepID=UPI0026E97A00|nr:5-formyltetrahydrofolate cyclo-ligase [Chryseobacterium koreense]